MVIPNLMAESGAKNAWLEPDEVVFDWLAGRLARRTGEAADACRARIAAGALYPDADATYLERHTVDLSTIEPVVALPHSPAKLAPLSQVAGTPVQQAFIGTCTNGRLEDLAEAAQVLRGRKVAAGTRLIVIPASSEVLTAALAAGYIATFIEAGAMLGVPGCGPCMGNHLGIPASGETVISTANRNFRGRMGNRDAHIYLASPQVVAASAALGRIPSREDLTGFENPSGLGRTYGITYRKDPDPRVCRFEPAVGPRHLFHEPGSDVPASHPGASDAAGAVGRPTGVAARRT
jgi:3-isopropylmalate/(R)-2-methylmalate dehydratase large subunit